MLKLFIAVVDAELLEAVFAKYFEAVDVKDPDHGRVWNIGVSGSGVYGRVDLGHDPGKKLVIHRLKNIFFNPKDKDKDRQYGFLGKPSIKKDAT